MYILWVWLFSLSIMTVRFIHVIVCISSCNLLLRSISLMNIWLFPGWGYYEHLCESDFVYMFLLRKWNLLDLEAVNLKFL